MAEASSRDDFGESMSDVKTPEIDRLDRWDEECCHNNPSWWLVWGSTAMSLTLFSMWGQTMRVFLEQLFGLACDRPGTVGWNSGDWAPCTTATGMSASTGGALFTDLPPNILGCFLLGLLSSSSALSSAFHLGRQYALPVEMNVACLPRSHRWQDWTIAHVGLRTGCCASLTTFASWNAQMVVMILGGEDATVLGTSQWVSALVGYMLGLLTAVASYSAGQHACHMLHRRTNPDLAQEADYIQDHLQDMAMHIHRELPDFERRYLYDIYLPPPSLSLSPDEYNSRSTAEDDEEQGSPIITTPDKHDRDEIFEIDNSVIQHHDSGGEGSILDSGRNGEMLLYLDRWKESTKRHRMNQFRYDGGSFMYELQAVEKSILVNGIYPTDHLELLQVAQNAAWDVEALWKWHTLTASKSTTPRRQEKVQHDKLLHDTIHAQNRVTVVLLLLTMGLLIWGCRSSLGDDLISVTYRTWWLSSLLSPIGTLLRWQLSQLNPPTHHPKRMEWNHLRYWLPLGTLIANVLASMLSLLMVAASLHVSNHLQMVWIQAIRSGVAGTLSTMSTFAMETVALLQYLPRRAWAYYYSFGSIFLSCIFGIFVYFWAIL